MNWEDLTGYQKRRAWGDGVWIIARPLLDKVWSIKSIKNVDQDRDIDFSGMDKIIILSDGGIITAAVRFRSSESGEDFSFRYGSNGKKAEFFKLKKAFEEGRSYPTYYIFGQTNFGKDDDPSLFTAKNFWQFYVMNMKLFMEGVESGKVVFSKPYRNKFSLDSGVYVESDMEPYIYHRVI